MAEPIDLQGKDAAWWAMQARRYKEEAASLQRRHDELERTSKEEQAKAIEAQAARHQESTGKLQQEHAKALEKLAQEHERVLARILAEPPEVRDLRLRLEEEATALAKSHHDARAELLASLRKE